MYPNQESNRLEINDNTGEVLWLAHGLRVGRRLEGVLLTVREERNRLADDETDNPSSENDRDPDSPSDNSVRAAMRRALAEDLEEDGSTRDERVEDTDDWCSD